MSPFQNLAEHANEHHQMSQDGLMTDEMLWTTKPSAANFGKGQAWFSDIGAMGYSDGVSWTVEKILPRQNVLSRCPVGAVQVAAGYGGYTTHIEAELAGSAIAVRIGIPNLTSGTPTIDGSFGFEATLGAIDSSQSKGGTVSTWNALTFGGAASGTHTATVSAAEPTWVWSDFITCRPLPRTDGEAGSIIHIRLIQGTAAGDATWFNGLWVASATSEAVVSHKYRCYRSTAAADYATTAQSSFAANSGLATSGAVPCIIQYVSLEQGHTLLTVGDSITTGAQASGLGYAASGYGWSAKARDLLSTSTVPVEVCNLGWPGQTMAQASARYLDIAAEVKNCLLFHMNYSPNNSSSPMVISDITTMRQTLAPSLAIASANGHRLIYQTGVPANAPTASGGLGGIAAKAFNAGDSNRVTYNSQLLDANELCIDVSTALSGLAVVSGTAVGQIEYNSSYTTDGLHPNNAGYDVWGNLVYNYLNGLI